MINRSAWWADHRFDDGEDLLSLPNTNFDCYNFRLNKVNEFNGNFIEAEMVKAFIDSIEYRRRFAP